MAISPPRSFDGRAVLVTGGQGGIGTAIAQELATRDATVYLARRPGSAMADRATYAASLRHLELDVTSEADWLSALSQIEREADALYGLVNNAAVLEPAIDFLDLDLARWRRHLSVNLDGSFLGCRSAMRTMAGTGGGAIVNVSSGAALLLRDGESPTAFAQALARLHPIGRIGTTADVAASVAFLLDPANDFLTGALLTVDGGQVVA